MQTTIRLGAKRARDYQSSAYEERYLARVRRVADADRVAGGEQRGFALTRETARYLALRMTYEDLIRVADIKTRPERFAQIRAEVKPGDADVLQVIDYFKPGLAEIAAVAPRWLARRLRRFEPKQFHRALTGGWRIETTSVSGFLLMRAMAGLKWWRPRSSRYREEQSAIETWLNTVVELSESDYDLALQYAECANLLKGYGDTYERGRRNFERITAAIPALRTDADPAARLAALRDAALDHAAQS